VELDGACGRLYAAFARYPLPTTTDHCVTADEVAATRTRPMRLLTAADLRPFMSHAASTWGDIVELKHFLPRVLELFAHEEVEDTTTVWTFMNRIGAAWHDWPDDERSAIRAFLGAWWRTTLGEYPRRLDVMEVLGVVGVLDVPVGPYLAHWETRRDEAAARHLAWLVRDFACHSASADEWYAALDRWIEGPVVRRLLEAVSAASTREVAAEFRHAREILDQWGGPPGPGRT
jgi:hypothetical protein